MLLGRRNLVYFAPTSGGKSMVAEILLLRSVLGMRKRALYVLPFVSIVTEKEVWLTKLLETVNVRLQAFHSQNEANWGASTDIALCTIEKANSLLNKMLEEQLYHEVEFIIIDELHMIMDEGRGHLIENLISKLRFLEKVKGSKVQLIAMSATMGGLDKLQSWLNTAIYQCNFRPVPLNEYFLSKGVLRTANATLMDVS